MMRLNPRWLLLGRLPSVVPYGILVMFLLVMVTIVIGSYPDAAVRGQEPDRHSPPPLPTAPYLYSNHLKDPYFAPGRRIYLERAKYESRSRNRGFEGIEFPRLGVMNITMRAATPLLQLTAYMYPAPDQQYLALLTEQLREELAAGEEVTLESLSWLQVRKDLAENEAHTFSFDVKHIVDSILRQDGRFTQIDGILVSWVDLYGFEGSFTITPDYLPFPAPLVHQTYSQDDRLLWPGGPVMTATPADPSLTPIPYRMEMPAEDRDPFPSFCKMVELASITIVHDIAEKQLEGVLIVDCPIESITNNAQVTALEHPIVIDEREQFHKDGLMDQREQTEDVYLADVPLVKIEELLLFQPNRYRPDMPPYEERQCFDLDFDCPPEPHSPVIEYEMPFTVPTPHATATVNFELTNVYHMEFAYPDSTQRTMPGYDPELDSRYLPLPEVLTTYLVDNPACEIEIPVQHITNITQNADLPPGGTTSNTHTVNSNLSAQQIFDQCNLTPTPIIKADWRTPIPTPMVQQAYQQFQFSINFAHDETIRLLNIITPTPSPTYAPVPEEQKRIRDAYIDLLPPATPWPMATFTPTPISVYERTY